MLPISPSFEIASIAFLWSWGLDWQVSGMALVNLWRRCLDGLWLHSWLRVDYHRILVSMMVMMVVATSECDSE